MNIEEIKNNEELRAYFFEYIASNVAVEFSDIFKVREIDKLRFQKESSEALLNLSEKIQQHTGSEEVLSIIEDTIAFYMNSFRILAARNRD